jgi:hypothetical protein
MHSLTVAVPQWPVLASNSLACCYPVIWIVTVLWLSGYSATLAASLALCRGRNAWSELWSKDEGMANNQHSCPGSPLKRSQRSASWAVISSLPSCDLFFLHVQVASCIFPRAHSALRNASTSHQSSPLFFGAWRQMSAASCGCAHQPRAYQFRRQVPLTRSRTMARSLCQV